MPRLMEVVEQNPWWKVGLEFQEQDPHLRRLGPLTFVRRPLALKPGQIYVIRGPRQVGKTTYLKLLIRRLLEQGTPPESILYVSVDFLTRRQGLRHILDTFFAQRPASPKLYLFLDEITALPEWHIEIKRLYDLGFLERATLVATGSAALPIRAKMDRLPGRGVEGNEYLLKPLMFRDFCLQVLPYLVEQIAPQDTRAAFRHLHQRLQGLTFTLERPLRQDTLIATVPHLLPFLRELQHLFHLYLRTGGFPRVINQALQDRAWESPFRAPEEPFETFVRDVLGDLARLGRSEVTAREILEALLRRYGNRFSFSKMAQELGIHHETLSEYLALLEESFVLFILYAWDLQRGTRKTKADKKVGFVDPFVLYALQVFLSGMPVPEVVSTYLLDEEAQARVVENVVAEHLRRHLEIPYRRESSTFLGFAYRRDQEVDTVVRVGQGWWGIEVKYRQTLRKVRPYPGVTWNLWLTREDWHPGEPVAMMPVEIFLALLPSSPATL